MCELCLTCQFVYQPRFIWESGTCGAILRWLSPPDVTAIESVARKHLRLSAGDHVSATFFAEGAFNKLFAITVSNRGSTLDSPQYIFRATTPVEPFFKTAGEVATLSYLQEHTSLPVPRIIAHSSTSANEVGCEWTLMEMVPGVALADAWSDIDLETKNKVTRSVGAMCANFEISDSASLGLELSISMKRLIRSMPQFMCYARRMRNMS
jgi:hypothetical protein